MCGQAIKCCYDTIENLPAGTPEAAKSGAKMACDALKKNLDANKANAAAMTAMESACKTQLSAWSKAPNAPAACK